MSFGLKTAAVKVAGTSASLSLLEAEDGGVADDVGNFQFVFSLLLHHTRITSFRRLIARCCSPFLPLPVFFPFQCSSPPAPHHLLYSLYVNRHACVN